MQNALELIAEALQGFTAPIEKGARALGQIADLLEQQLKVLEEIRLNQAKILHSRVRLSHDQEG